MPAPQAIRGNSCDAETVPMTTYLDYNATTPLDRRVFEVMVPWFVDEPGNAGSRTHVFGQRAKDAVEKARGQIASLIGAQPEEIIFTSGATEANNLATLGLAEFGTNKGRKHIISSAIEHKALLEPLERLSAQGFNVELVPVTSGGYVEPDEVRRRLRRDTLLVSIMHSNNETGVLQPVQEISELVTPTGAFFHTDAAQTFGKELSELNSVRADLVSISGHKIYGPKGVGALYVRRRKSEKRALNPVLFGGGQERGLRPGTLPVPLIVGFGHAASLAQAEAGERHNQAAKVKMEFLQKLTAVEHRVNGDLARTQSHVLNVSFPGVDSEALMMATREELAFSNGSACTSSSYSPSHVLKAMGLDDDRITSAVRLSWGQGIERVPAELLVETIKTLRIG